MKTKSKTKLTKKQSSRKKLTKKQPSRKKLTKKKTSKVTGHLIVSIRQISARSLLPGRKHFLRLIKDTSPHFLSFNSTNELNEFLFQFDVDNYGKDPAETGTWIDMIVTDVDGELFDLDALEGKND